MKFTTAIDEFIGDWKSLGKMRSPHTEKAYRDLLDLHAQDVDNRDPSKVGKRDLMRTLQRWEHPNSYAQKLAILRSFYRWTLYADLRTTNPAEQIPPPSKQQPEQVRLTRQEAVRLIQAADPVRRDRWAVRIMLLAGIRNDELRSLQGRHLSRDGWVWVDREAGKGGKERFVPVAAELRGVVEEVRLMVGPEDFILPGRRRVHPPLGDEMAERPDAKLSSTALRRQVMRIGARAGLPFHLTPHALRHTFAAAAVRSAGDRATQAALGHASIQTTIDTYSGRVSLDELAVSFQGFGYGVPELSPAEHPQEASDGP